MITVHWLWLPLIITLALMLLTFLFNNFNVYEPQNEPGALFMILTSISFLISSIIYIIAAFNFLFTHVTFTT